ncbi:hypothetical protein BS50DRAFT_594890 [Corynespora cassiicola Philippines]|uniref:Sodium/calcium exchanger membrane region domain-containing protein n=1 Tax=Corynespora cassiicola Philippines TaxID=1448308 RepID=A0A2T2N156_CORCC|nr:hypothetical protein BS50DRAFT_594890 [Corynespora cassiicola Philippines]
MPGSLLRMDRNRILSAVRSIRLGKRRRLLPFWCLCIIAVVAFGVTFVLSLTSVEPVVKFFIALLSTAIAATVQRFALAEAVVILSHRNRTRSAVLLEAILGNWTQSAVAVIAVLRGQTGIAQNALVGTVAFHHLLLLGACFLHGSHHNGEAAYPALIVLPYARLLTVTGAVIVFPTVFQRGSQGNDAGSLAVSGIASILLLVLFSCHGTFFCQIHSAWVSEARGLRKLLDGRGGNTDVYHFNQRLNGRVTLSVAEYLQARRKVWLASQTGSDRVIGLQAHGPKVLDSAIATVALLSSCVVILCSCFYLLSSGPGNGAAEWILPSRLGYLVLPLTAALSEMVALCLHASSYKRHLQACEIVQESIASGTRVVDFALPACALAAWAIGSSSTPMLFDLFQIGVLGFSLFLPTIAIQNHSDDWFTGATLVALYVLFASSAWLST